jgi:amino acid adenylation domain-containing protein
MNDFSQRIAQLSPAQLETLRQRLQTKEAAIETAEGKITPRRQHSNVSPQSFAQQRLWILDKLRPGNPAYNIPTPMRFLGKLEIGILERVFDEIVRRHESLRTHFAAAAEGPVQIVEPASHFVLEVIDLSHLPADEREQEARRLGNQDTQQPFDLSRAPLWRTRLLRLSETDHILLFIAHHIVTDAWSLSVLLKEILEIYKAFAAGQVSPLAELPIQYADYAVWQREWLQGEVLERQLAYWKENLDGAPVLLELPADRVRPPVQTFAGTRIVLHFGRELSEALVELTRRQGVTLFMTLLSAFKVLLHRYSRQTDIVVGSPVANRKGTEVEKLIGFFVNTVAIRTDLSGNPRFSDFLKQVREASLAAFSHQDVPFERVVEELTPERNLSHSPLFQAVFALQNIRVEPWELPGLKLSSIELDSGHSKFDIALTLVNSDEGIWGRVEYNTDLFAEQTIRRMMVHLQELLNGVCVAPDQRVLAIPMLPAEEREQISEWNSTAVEYPLACVQEVIEQQAERTPKAIIVCLEDRRLTYEELNRRANQLGRYLKRRGVGPEVLVAILMQRSVEMVVAMLGILKAGGAYLPLDAGYPAARLRYMLQDSGAGLILTQGRLIDLVTQATDAQSSMEVIRLDEQWTDIALENDSNLDCEVSADNLAYLIYTSGSTGTPKGAMLPHRGLTNHMRWIQDVHQLGTGDAVLQKTPFSFDVSVWEFFWPLMVGARLVFAKDQADLDTDYLTNLIDEHQITVVYFVASALQMFLATRKSGTCESLRYVFCGGEAMPLHVQRDFFKQFPAVGLHNIYGPTEATIDVTWWDCEKNSERRSVPIGRPLPNTTIHLLDEELREVPVGVAGELYVAGANLGRGYWRRPDLTAERFIPNPFASEPGARFYRTGDLARYLADGAIEFLGRIDHQVKVRGFRIELGEIDAALGSHPAISECVTILGEEHASDKRLVTYIVPANGEVETAALRSHLLERLPDYMVPKTFIRLERLPRTPSGKIDRGSLPEAGVSRRDVALPYSEPRSELERRLAQIWCDVLKVERVGLDDNFFDLGGHSLLLIQVHGRLREELGLQLSAIDLFKYPTIGSLAEHLGDSRTGDAEEWLVQAQQRADNRRTAKRVESDIAIIGMAGRFPGAANIAEFWENLRNGVESMREFSEAEMRAAGVGDELLRQDAYVRRGTVFEKLEWFDAEFFGLTPREAESMDPQQRLFLECAWEVVEDAGYDCTSYPLPIGMFAGAATNSYMFWLMSNRALFRSLGGFQLKLLNDKDFLTSRVSYKLGLKGPSLTVQTACSTSLVAVHLACQSLLNGECSMALAGGVAIVLPQRSGYLHQAGGLISPDGYCRPFDARAAGIVGGSGVGVVLLKPLSAALADGDSIRAVIKGSAINNDGALKVGYTAPSVTGQAAVIAEAQIVAGVHPESISYIEAHGTATSLGDPIEVAALTQAFRTRTKSRQFCAIGSVKSNIGHLDTAAGVAGLIKTVLALEHEELPASLHYEQPNPEIDFAESPFYVNAQLRDWPRKEGEPRRAGVSSFGMGGTNAHLILEEAPPVESRAKQDEAADQWQVLLLSARSADSLAAAQQLLATHLVQHPEQELPDVAYTLQVGRHHFAHRAAIVTRDRSDAAAALRANDPRTVWLSVEQSGERPVAFLFPGIGDHYVNMAAGIYAAEETFREEVDRCCELLKEHLGSDLREFFYPAKAAAAAQNVIGATPSPGLDLRRMLNRAPADDDAETKRLNETLIAQPAVFVIEYAMARLLMRWGIKPQAMLGYSIGEYVAACLSGVLSLEDALLLVARRAQMIQTLPTGALFAVPLSEAGVRDYLSEQLWVAAVNGPALCVLAGSNEAIKECEQKLSSKDLACRRLPTSHPFHSQLLAPIAEQFTNVVRKVKLNAPKIPYISNVTGTWITAADVQNEGYWARHMCQTVRFADGLEELWKEPRRVMLEVGPGQSLTSLALQARPDDKAAEQVALPSIRNSYEQQPDMAFLSSTLAKLWLAGVSPDWSRVHGDRSRRRVSLPTYNFDRRYYWLPQSNGDASKPSVRLEKQPDIESWFYLPSWRRTAPLSLLQTNGVQHEKQSWLIFVDAVGLGLQVTDLLEQEGHDIVTVDAGEEFRASSDHAFTIARTQPDDYDQLLSNLQEANWSFSRIVHFWTLDAADESLSGSELFDQSQAAGFYSLLYLAQALGRRGSERVEIAVVSDQIQEVTADETLRLEQSTVLGPCKVIPQEYPEISCRSIDIVAPSPGSKDLEQVARQLAGELLTEDPAETIAHRHGYRWTQDFEPVQLKTTGVATRLRDGGTYLIIGGLGHIGLTLAEYFARKLPVQLVLTGRSGLPPRNSWHDWLDQRRDTKTASRIRKVLELERLGASVCVLKANVSDRSEMRDVVNVTLERFGTIDGVVYLAGMLGGASFSPVPETTRDQCEPNFEAKGHGLYVLEEVLEGIDLDFCVLFSSLASVLGGLGFAAYTAANAFIDAFVRKHNRASRVPWVSENWDTWLVGEEETHAIDFKSTQSDLNMTPAQATAAFQAILSAGALTQVVVSVGDLRTRLEKWIKRQPASNGSASALSIGASHPRPGLRNAFVAPRGEIEQDIAEIWEEVLGIKMIGIYDNFFELGGHSLLGTQVISRIRKRFQEDISVRTFFTSPTIAEVAEIIVQRRIEQVDSATLSQLISEVKQLAD